MKKIKKLICSSVLLGSIVWLCFGPKASASGVGVTPHCSFGTISDLEPTQATLTIDNGMTVVKVTDASYTNSNQPKYHVDLSSFGITPQMIYYHSYSTYIVEFTIYMREIEDGYQEIYLQTPSGNNYVSPLNFEYGPGYKKTNYSYQTFYAEIPYTLLDTNGIDIRFAAHGANNDDWLLKDEISVSIRGSYDTRQITTLTCLTNYS